MIHHGELAAPAHVAGVGQQLTHEIDQPLAAHDLETLIAICRKQHVTGLKGHAGGDRHRFLAGGLHIESELALALETHHAIIEQAREQHIPQAESQILGRDMRIPRTDGAMRVVEHANQPGRESSRVTPGNVARGSRHARPPETAANN